MTDLTATEESIAEDIAKMMGAAPTPEEVETAEVEVVHYEFDNAFQKKILALSVRDTAFNRSIDGLIKPEYFENTVQATLASLATEFFSKYKVSPTKDAFVNVVKDAIKRKLIRSDMKEEVGQALVAIYKANLTDGEYVADQVAEFARHQAMARAALDFIDLIEKRQFDKAAEVVKKASEVGKASEEASYDYFEENEHRAEERKAEIADTSLRRGISTGIKALDKELYHNGWGRKELVVFMAGPKMGKSTALGDFAKFGALGGYNVLYVTLEVSKRIVSERLDANLANIIVNQVRDSPNEVYVKIKAIEASNKLGKLIIEERPTGSMTPNELNRIIQKHKGNGLIFDMICVDYADIMAPNIRTQDIQENSKNIYIELRAIAQRENVAMLTATQTNREGAKSTVSRMEHVAEDFNKVRIADLLISINKSEDEKNRGVARLFFAASRNQKGEITIYIKQEQERMRFITEVIESAAE